MEAVLTVSNVTTSLGERTLIKDISFTLQRGEVLALVGHNGAGKSTLMKTIIGTLQKDKGTIVAEETYDQDEDFITFKKCLAYLPEEPMLFTELTVMQHFQLYGLSYDVDEATFHERVERYINGFQLSAKLSDFPEQLSKGMRQKVQAICSLLPDVPILLIDEPFIGLDVYAMEFLLQLIEEKVNERTSIILTTHQLDQVRSLADRFLLLENGHIEATGNIESFETITRGADDV